MAAAFFVANADNLWQQIDTQAIGLSSLEAPAANSAKLQPFYVQVRDFFFLFPLHFARRFTPFASVHLPLLLQIVGDGMRLMNPYNSQFRFWGAVVADKQKRAVLCFTSHIIKELANDTVGEITCMEHKAASDQKQKRSG